MGLVFVFDLGWEHWGWICSCFVIFLDTLQHKPLSLPWFITSIQQPNKLSLKTIIVSLTLKRVSQDGYLPINLNPDISGKILKIVQLLIELLNNFILILLLQQQTSSHLFPLFAIFSLFLFLFWNWFGDKFVIEHQLSDIFVFSELVDNYCELLLFVFVCLADALDLFFEFSDFLWILCFFLQP